MSKNFHFDNSLGSIEDCLEALQHRRPTFTEDLLGLSSSTNFFSPRNTSATNSERFCRCKHDRDISTLKHEVEGLKSVFSDKTEHMIHLEVLFQRALNQIAYEIESIDDKKKKISQLEAKISEKINTSHIQSFQGPTCAFQIPHKNLSRSPGEFSFSNNEGEETSNFSFGEIDENIDVHLPREKDCKDFEEFLKKQQSSSLISERILEDHETMNIPYVFDVTTTSSNSKSVTPGECISERYRVETVIASTHFSTVLQCQDLFERKKCCLKMIHNQKETFDQGLDEIKIMNLLQKASQGKLAQKYIVKMIEFFYYKENLYIVYELLGENLFVISSNPSQSLKLKKENIKRITKQLLVALAFIHSQGVIHADIKPENILLANPINSHRKSLPLVDIRLVDFGSSCYVTDTLTTYIQSKAYRAPEVIVGGRYDAKIDIWSLGCVVAELISGKEIFAAKTLKEMLTKIFLCLGSLPNEGKLLSVYVDEGGIIDQEEVEWESIEEIVKGDEELADFLRFVLCVDPEQRFTAEDALNHPWLN